MNKYIFCGSLAIFLSGCGTFSQSLVAQKTVMSVPILKFQEPDSRAKAGDMHTLPGQLRAVHVKYNEQKQSYLICAEPMPDVALSDSFKNALAVKANEKIQISEDLTTTTAALALAGRTQLVLISREFLYRTCEGGLNGWLSNSELKDMYKDVLTNITLLVKAEMKNADANANLAKAALAKSGLDPKILEATDKDKVSKETDFVIEEYNKCQAKAGDDKAKAKCKSELMERFPKS